MSYFCRLLPDKDKPILFPCDNTVQNNFQQAYSEETEENSESTMYDNEDIFNEKSFENGEQRQIILPQPTMDMQTPLTLEGFVSSVSLYL